MTAKRPKSRIRGTPEPRQGDALALAEVEARRLRVINAEDNRLAELMLHQPASSEDEEAIDAMLLPRVERQRAEKAAAKQEGEREEHI